MKFGTAKKEGSAVLSNALSFCLPLLHSCSLPGPPSSKPNALKVAASFLPPLSPPPGWSLRVCERSQHAVLRCQEMVGNGSIGPRMLCSCILQAGENSNSHATLLLAFPLPSSHDHACESICTVEELEGCGVDWQWWWCGQRSITVSGGNLRGNLAAHVAARPVDSLRDSSFSS